MQCFHGMPSERVKLVKLEKLVKKGEMGGQGGARESNVRFLFWAFLSIVSSVGIILVNKTLMRTYGFTYVLTLTAFHFTAQAILMELLAAVGIIRSHRLPFQENVSTALAGVSSIVFMNFNLQFNSVGFYQMTKLLCIPLMVYIETVLYGKSYTGKVKFSLFLVLLGVGIAAITDIEASWIGSFVGALAVMSTTQFQLWQGEKKEQYKVTPIQLTHSVSIPLAVICGIFAIVSEGFLIEDSIFKHSFDEPIEITLIILSCVFAISVNICSFTLIGNSSAVTYQVIGHLKTVLVLLGGLILFPFYGSTERLINNLLGIFIAMIGVILYGYLKSNSKSTSPDALDRYCPRSIGKMISYFDGKPSYSRHDGAAMMEKV